MNETPEQAQPQAPIVSDALNTDTNPSDLHVTHFEEDYNPLQHVGDPVEFDLGSDD